MANAKRSRSKTTGDEVPSTPTAGQPADTTATGPRKKNGSGTRGVFAPAQLQLVNRTVFIGRIDDDIGGEYVAPFIGSLAIAYFDGGERTRPSWVAHFRFTSVRQFDTDVAQTFRARYASVDLVVRAGRQAVVLWNELRGTHVDESTLRQRELVLDTARMVATGATTAETVGKEVRVFDEFNGGVGEPGPHAICSATFADERGASLPSPRVVCEIH